MSRHTARDTESLYALHARWIREVLPSGSSLFSPSARVWTPECLDELDRHFIGQPDFTKDKRYLDKLRDQLAGASGEAVQLMAELHAIHFLPIWTGALSSSRKKADIEAILSWMPKPASLPADVIASFEPGLVNPGTWVFTRRDTQITWIIRFSLAWLQLEPSRRDGLLGDPWGFKSFVMDVQSPSADAARLAMLHLTFPDDFEPIVSNKHKKAIAERFAEQAGADPDVDRRLQSIRRALTPLEGDGFGFYRGGLALQWMKPRKAWRPFLTWIERIRSLEGFDELERDYKLKLATRIAEAKAAVTSGSPEWPDVVKSALTQKDNNLVPWMVTDRFGRWLKDDPEAARKALLAIWGPGKPWERLAAFAAAVPQTVLNNRGQQLNFGSYLLMGEDPRRLPPVKVTPVGRALRLLGWPPIEQAESAAELYRRALTLFEEVHHEGAEWSAPLRDPLDAQSAIWTLVSSSERPNGLPEEWWSDLQAYRKEAPPIGSDEADEGEEGQDDAVEEDDPEPPAMVDHLAKAAEELHVDRAHLDEIVELLEDKGQVVFYGPPGTGKTYLALRLARAIAEGDESRVSIVQFHPATTYEDFIEGLRPRLTPQGHVTYEVVPGPLVRIAEEARSRPLRRHVLIVDEVNRANLPKVFGELLFLLEYRRERAKLTYRPEEAFGLPENLSIIGTMNTADRSIALIDAAMRRRFHFVPFFPHEGAMRGLLRRWLRKQGGRTAVADLLDAVNAELLDDLGDHLLIGPSHFMRTDLSDPALERIWTYNVFPLIEEQYWGNRSAVDRWRWASVRQRFAAVLDGQVDAVSSSDVAASEPGEGDSERP